MPIKSRLRELVAEKAAREKKKLSIKQVALDTGLAETTLRSLVYNTTQRFDAPVLEKLCIYFGISLSDLLIYYPEEKMSSMDEFDSQDDNVMEILKRYYPSTIDEMPYEFRSHQFILRLAERHQPEYIDALKSYRDSKAPFGVLHGQIAKMLHQFEPELVELIAEAVSSRDIWGNPNKCSKWRKRH